MSSAQVACLLPRAVESHINEQVLEGCAETEDIAFSDLGHRAFLYGIIVNFAGYGHELVCPQIFSHKRMSILNRSTRPQLLSVPLCRTGNYRTFYRTFSVTIVHSQ
ncbi:hypothetical protein Y032_1407g3868 [Ancylostoma ceylanicum]|uniref:Uncharacterized protein n=1 Tax=Ancylostoma ceylanicum TaxID=53326 RepID=A0A016W4N0_9BILA|nr:hypothetical protein Y032_1407g3868 [Ancylostoma ceylanicum]